MVVDLWTLLKFRYSLNDRGLTVREKYLPESLVLISFLSRLDVEPVSIVLMFVVVSNRVLMVCTQ